MTAHLRQFSAEFWGLKFGLSIDRLHHFAPAHSHCPRLPYRRLTCALSHDLVSLNKPNSQKAIGFQLRSFLRDKDSTRFQFIHSVV